MYWYPNVIDYTDNEHDEWFGTIYEKSRIEPHTHFDMNGVPYKLDRIYLTVGDVK